MAIAIAISPRHKAEIKSLDRPTGVKNKHNMQRRSENLKDNIRETVIKSIIKHPFLFFVFGKKKKYRETQGEEERKKHLYPSGAKDRMS